jgi:hypothetical protein
MDRGVAALIAEAAAPDGQRAVACGPSEPGNAWDDYLLALEETAAHPPTAPANLRLFLGRGREADLAHVEREVAAHASALDRMSRGARKAAARPPLRWDGEALLPNSGEGVLRRLAEIAVCKGRLLRDGGEVGASVRLLLETAQFARDGAANTTSEFEWEAFRALELVLVEFTDLVVSRSVKGEDLERLERGLRTLDETLSRDGRTFLNDVAFQGVRLQRGDPYLEANEFYRLRRPLSPGWRHAFSMRLFKADAFERWLEAARNHAAAGTKGWDEARADFDRNTNLMEGPPENPILNRLTPPSLEVNRSREAQLRLLRIAVQFQRTGRVEPHADPFGSRADLICQVEGNFLRAWSRGPNGIDDGGGEAARPRSSTGSTTIIGPPMGEADDIGIAVEK